MSTQIDPFALVPHHVIQHWGIFLAMGIGLIFLAMVAWVGSVRASIHTVDLTP